MRMSKRLVAWIGLFLILASASRVEAGKPWGRRSRVVVAPTSASCPNDLAPPSGMLGSFVSTPHMIVRGDGAAGGGGYSPLGLYGPTTLSLYGPLSPLRATAAPVLTYSRGYDGVVRPTVGTSFSTPNQPSLTPVVYPTRANLYGGSRSSSAPPWWPGAINFIDLN